MTGRYFVAALALTIAATLLALVYYPRLPEQIPIHWNIHGAVDRYGSKLSCFILPGIMLSLLLLFRALAWLSPRSFDVETFRPTYDYVAFLIISLLAYLHAVTLFAATHPSTDVGRLFLGGLFFFFAAMGNVLGKVRRNFWMGVRTPWTLASERVWNDTHRFAARIFVVVGLLGLVVILSGAPPFFALILLIIAALLSAGYSLIDYKILEKRGQL